MTSRAAAALTALSENVYLSAIRAGMVAIVPLTIVGGLFLIATHLPVAGWEARVAPYLPVLQIPFTPANPVDVVDESALRQEVDFCIAGGVHGLVVPLAVVKDGANLLRPAFTAFG